MTDREKLRSWAELEARLGNERTVPPSVTRKDVERLTRKRLGPLWSRKRRAWKP